MANRSSWLKYLIPIFLVVTVFAIQAGTSLAATKCCACTHPNVTGGRFCIKDYAADCADLSKSTNTELKDANCLQDPSVNPCKKITAGVCLNDPADEMSFKLSSVPGYKAPEAKKEEIKTLPVQLNIQVPGLTMYDAYEDDKEVIVPALAQYIQALQTILIGIGVIAAALMVMYGGFLYIISGTGAKVREGQQIIKDALIGLVIILGSAVILNNINPNTANLSALHLYRVTGDYYTNPVASREGVAGPATKADELEIIEGVKMAGGDPCHILAFCQHETGLRMIWNGWPKNPKTDAFSFGACSGDLKFIQDNSPNDKKLRKAFPGIWPPLGKDNPSLPPFAQKVRYNDMPEKAEVLLNNPRVNGYYAAISIGRSSVLSEAGAGIGSANIIRWRKENCPPGPYQDPTIAQAVAMGFVAAFSAVCLPDAAAGGAGCPKDKHNCSPLYPDKLNTPTKGYEISPSGTIYGQCASTGARCWTIWTRDQVYATVKNYKVFDAKYHCSSGGRK